MQAGRRDQGSAGCGQAPLGLLSHAKDLLLPVGVRLSPAPVAVHVQALLVQLRLQPGSPAVQLLMLAPGCPLSLQQPRLCTVPGCFRLTLRQTWLQNSAEPIEVSRESSKTLELRTRTLSLPDRLL